MAKGSWKCGKKSKVIVEADGNRDDLLVISMTDAEVFLGFCEEAEEGKGVVLLRKGDSVAVHGHLARNAVFGCTAEDAEEKAEGTWQDGSIVILRGMVT